VKKFFKRRPVLVCFCSLIFILLITVVVMYISNLRREKNLLKIQIGDSKARVLSLLGKPSEVTTASGGFLFFDLLDGYREHWCYGPQLLTHRPFINLRIFGPSDEDFVLIFKGGKVVEIQKPKTR